MPRATPTRARKSRQEVEKEYARLADEVKQQTAVAGTKDAELARAREAEAG